LFLNDQETEVDLLYYEPIANTVVKLIRETPGAPITVGVHGDWGAGKSSVLKMTQRQLERDERVLCLWFNGWTFEGFEDAKTVVIETIVDELRRARPASTKVAEAARKVLKRIDWLKVAKKAGGLAFTAITGLPSLDQLSGLANGLQGLLLRSPSELAGEVKGFADQAGAFLKDAREAPDPVPEQIHAFRKEFSELIDAADVHQVVVLVDDLDRCLPATAIATLEAIRLFLFVPKTAFVVGADELMIEYAVREHFPDLPPASGTTPYARNYLEKLIQVPFRIPALGVSETRSYVSLLLLENALGSKNEQFKKILDIAREDLRRPWLSRGLDRAAVKKAFGAELPHELDQALVLSAQVAQVLTEGTRGNPRQTKRFLNSMLLRYAIAEERGFAAEIQRTALAKIMLAERFSPDFYEQIARLAATAADGRPPALAQLELGVRAAPEEPEDDGDSTPKKFPRKADAATAAPELADWNKIEWVTQWARLEPLLADVDLRPYFFVTRDKRGYLGSVPGASALDVLVDLLMGPDLRIRSAAAEIRKLSGTEAEYAFDEVRSRILQADKFDTKPKGVDGLVGLVKHHPALQKRLLGFIKELRTPGLGAWAATSWGQCLTDPAVELEVEQLLRNWSNQDENGVLKNAAGGALRLRKR
jgi:hypothetical protein